ncbi:MAG: hypothetical protein ABI648_10820 [Betaproteobacteria bacterium]
MPDAQPTPPASTAANAFRALIEERRIALDFGGVRDRQADGTVDIGLDKRILVDAATAARLLSALHTCLRDHETRWRIAAPAEQTPTRAPTPSHAEPDAAAQKATQLFRIMDELRTPYLYERSVRLTGQTLAANRFLLSLSRQSVKGDFRHAALGLCEQLAMPAAFRAAAAEQLDRARAVHLGFEGDDRILFKYYIEYDAAAQEASRAAADAPATLHVAYKWDTADPAHCVVSRYLLYPALTQTQILERMAHIYQAAGNEASLDIARGVLAVACTRVEADALQYLEVREDGNERLSFDLNFYDAGLLVKDLQAPLAQMRQRFAIKPGQFQALYDQIKAQTAGHLAGGVHRNGHDFFNVYYGVQRRQG